MAAAQCTFSFIQLQFGFCQPKIKTLSHFTSTLYAPFTYSTPKSSASNLKLRARSFKNCAKVSALVSKESPVGSSATAYTDMYTLTYLEGNSWLWDVNGLKLLVDPTLVGTLDFGVPWPYDAAKRILRNFSVMYLEPGRSHDISVADNSSFTVRATAGPVLGPPCNDRRMGNIAITPVAKQILPGLTLISGQEDAAKLAKLLNAKFVVPMKNGDLVNKGLLSELIRSVGTTESFKEIISNELTQGSR